MPLPEKASTFLDCAATTLKQNTESVINFYAEVFGSELESKVEKIINDADGKLAEYGVRVSDVESWRIVREVGPRRYHVAVDLKVLK
jgi:tRNA G37 N-methylase Trm5